MTEEKELKKKGEELAIASVESQLGSKQLRTIYTLTKTKPLPMVEAFVQRQIARVSGTKALEMVLDLLKNYGETKAAFSRILMYANMLYDYYERQAAMKFNAVTEESAKRICEQQGSRYLGLDISTERGHLEVQVKVRGYRGDPKQLAFSILRDILYKNPNFPGKIWVQQVDRR